MDQDSQYFDTLMAAREDAWAEKDEITSGAINLAFSVMFHKLGLRTKTRVIRDREILANIINKV